MTTALLLLASLVLVSIPLALPARAQTVVATVGVGDAPEGVAYDSYKGEIFVANDYDNTVSAISTTSPGGSSGIPGFPVLIDAALVVAVVFVASYVLRRLGGQGLPGEVERPTAAFVLSLVGGIFVLLVGYDVVIEVGGDFGFLGALWGVLTIIGAIMLYANPERHATWGALIIVLSALSWIGALGGGFVGFLLGLIGGILGMTFNPKPVAASVPPAPPQAQ